MLSVIFKVLEEEGINLEWWDFPDYLLGVYVEIDDCKVIGLKKDIDRSNRKLKCILSEELGHYFTGSTYKNSKPKNYREEIEISRNEYRAKKWQVFFLIPEDKFLEAIRKGITEIWELAEYFDVDEEVIKFYLRLPRVKELLRGYIK